MRIACGQLAGFSSGVSPAIVGVYCEQTTESPPAEAASLLLDCGGEATRLRRLLVGIVAED